MISNFNKPNRKDDFKLLTLVIAIFICILWLCTPPGNKFLQMCFFGNHVKYFIVKITDNDATTKYIFHRNNAIYLAKLYKNKPYAVEEMNKAIEAAPSFVADSEMKLLYKERAQIKLYVGDYNGALDDYLHSENISFTENLTVAMLLKERGNYRLAGTYCNAILNTDAMAYAGYACLSELYTSIGKYETALHLWDLAIDRNKNNPRAYLDRAKIKKKIGDIKGYEDDVVLAKKYLPTIDEDESITYDALHPKILSLQIRPL